MARQRWLTPETIPGATRCRTLLIPDNLDILMAVSGALLALTYSYNWEKFGAVEPEDMAEAMFVMYRDFVASLDDCEASMLPVGTILQFASALLPDGFLYCNGDEVLKTAYPDLFAVVGTLWGTPTLGSDYFVLPDFRNKSPYGYDYGSAPPHFAFASNHGEELHTLTTSEIPAHHHDQAWFVAGANVQAGSGWAFNAAGGGSGATTGDTGGGNPHNTLHPVAVCGFIIYAGV